MRILELIKAWLFGQRKQKYKITHPDLYDLDIDAIAKELEIEREAARLGAAGIPSPEANILCGVESTIVQRIHKARLDYVDWARGRIQAINEILIRRDISHLVERALQADEEFARKADAVFSENEALLPKLAERKRITKTELDAFRQQHFLTRDANYPTGTASFLRYSILIFLILVEGGANAWFFSQGLDSGFIGGFVAAALFASMNLISAFLIGKFLIRFVFHRQVVGKIIGIGAAISAFVVMTGISLTIAHYRDALILEMENPARQAWETLQNNLFGLNDIFSWLLFGISMLFAILAVFDGLFSDDLYPGYGRIVRRANAAHDEFHDEVEGIREDLDSLRQEEIKGLDEGLQQAQSQIAQAIDYIDSKRSAESRLATAIDNADHCMQALIKRFRDTNAIHRNGAPVPNYFNQNPPLPFVDLPDFGLAQDQISLAQQTAKLNTLQNKINEIRANIQAAYNREHDRLKPLAGQLGD